MDDCCVCRVDLFRPFLLLFAMHSFSSQHHHGHCLVQGRQQNVFNTGTSIQGRQKFLAISIGMRQARTKHKVSPAHTFFSSALRHDPPRKRILEVRKREATILTSVVSSALTSPRTVNYTE